MSAFQVLGMLAFLLASLVVSIRLLLLARRTRQLPEFTIGMALLLGGCLGNILIYFPPRSVLATSES